MNSQIDQPCLFSTTLCKAQILKLSLKMQCNSFFTLHLLEPKRKAKAFDNLQTNCNGVSNRTPEDNGQEMNHPRNKCIYLDMI
jgi:hypothetical protein